MQIVGDVVVSDDVLREAFVCNLKACKGACCVEGDAGAPIEPDELAELETLQEAVRPLLTEEGRQAIDVHGPFTAGRDGSRTPLRPDGACAYVTFDTDRTAKCGIEQAYQKGLTNFRKPISCHLYPIRVKKLFEGEALNYHRWDICSPACSLGEALKVPVYRFLKEALIRRYGEEWYGELEESLNSSI